MEKQDGFEGEDKKKDEKKPTFSNIGFGWGQTSYEQKGEIDLTYRWPIKGIQWASHLHHPQYTSPSLYLGFLSIAYPLRL